MHNKLDVRKRFQIFSKLMLVLMVGLILEINIRYPNKIDLYEGEQFRFHSGSPFTVNIPAQFGGMLGSDGIVQKDNLKDEKNVLQSVSAGKYDVNLMLFGVLPIRSIEVNVSPQKELVPCGNTIGIKILTQGLVTVGLSELRSVDGYVVNLANDYDVRVGDIILSANDVELSTVEQLSELVSEGNGKNIRFTIERDGKNMIKELTPIKTDDGYKLGIWVRDSTAGIGTLTFFEPKSHQFGALGHPITDADTGAMMPVSKGTILNATVFNVKKGERGAPGELKGIFKGGQRDLGVIDKNTKHGIYGSINEELLPSINNAVPIASRNQIKEGKAYILSNIQDDNVEQFEIEIQRVMKYNNDSYKDLVIKVTDEKLLDRTGGIVQGMSGSPILQNGCIVGAVTHVFINDPTRGYGVFIENMLQNLGE